MTLERGKAEAVIKQVAALRAKTIANGATAAEQAAALRMAEKLLAKHGLTEDRIRPVELDDFVDYDFDDDFRPRRRSLRDYGMQVATFTGALAVLTGAFLLVEFSDNQFVVASESPVIQTSPARASIVEQPIRTAALPVENSAVEESAQPEVALRSDVAAAMGGAGLTTSLASMAHEREASAAQKREASMAQEREASMAQEREASMALEREASLANMRGAAAGAEAEVPAETVDIGAPPSEDAMAQLARARVSLHFESATAQQRAADLAVSLADLDAGRVEMKRVPLLIGRSHVRYFNKTDRAAAEAAVALLRGAATGDVEFAAVDAEPQDFSSFEPAPPPNTIEIWVGSL